MRDLELTRQLLCEVFPTDPKFESVEYLEWLYGSPAEALLQSNADDNLGRIGHYALLPQQWLDSGSKKLWALSLNTAVSPRARGLGLFAKLAEATYEKATEIGVSTVIGVANANSTPGFVKRLGFRLLGQLPVSVVPRFFSRRSRHLDRIELSNLLESEWVSDQTNQAAVAQEWNHDTLRWRLTRPADGLAIFEGSEFVAITKKASHRGVPVAIILKIFKSSLSSPRDLLAISNAACRHHGALFSLYACFGSNTTHRGFNLPGNLRPSPLNIIIRNISENSSDETQIPTSFEFLDFDAY
jgi:GNAT superfamily N-acetyltransferase